MISMGKHKAEEILANKSLANTINSELGISNRDVVALQILSALIYPPIKTKKSLELSDEQKKLVQEFLKDIEGNMKFNGQLEKIEVGAWIKNSISSSLISDMRTFSYKTRHYKGKEQGFSDASHKLFSKYNLGVNLTESNEMKEDKISSKKKEDKIKLIEKTKDKEEDKISLADYGLIYDISKLNTVMSSLDKAGVFRNNSYFEQLSANCQKSEEIMDKVEKDFRKQFIDVTKDKPGGIILARASSSKSEDPRPFSKRPCGKACDEIYKNLGPCCINKTVTDVKAA